MLRASSISNAFQDKFYSNGQKLPKFKIELSYFSSNFDALFLITSESIQKMSYFYVGKWLNGAQNFIIWKINTILIFLLSVFELNLITIKLVQKVSPCWLAVVISSCTRHSPLLLKCLYQSRRVRGHVYMCVRSINFASVYSIFWLDFWLFFFFVFIWLIINYCKMNGAEIWTIVLNT